MFAYVPDSHTSLDLLHEPCLSSGESIHWYFFLSVGAERGCGSLQAPCPLRISAKSSLPEPISLSDFSSWTEKILSSSSTSSSPSSFAPELPSDLPPLAAVSRMALPAEKTALSAPPLANGGPFSIPDGCLDCEDGDDIIGDELDELLDSVSDPGDGGMVSPLAL